MTGYPVITNYRVLGIMPQCCGTCEHYLEDAGDACTLTEHYATVRRDGLCDMWTAWKSLVEVRREWEDKR